MAEQSDRNTSGSRGESARPFPQPFPGGTGRWCGLLLLGSSLLPLALAPLVGQGQSQRGKPSETQLPKPSPSSKSGPRVRLPEDAPAPAEPERPAPAAPPSTAEDTIRIATDLVTVVTTVTSDSPASPLPPLPLTRDDFRLLEDGQPQEIVNFARDVDLPLHLAILVDTSLSVGSRLDFQRQALSRFFERVLRPGDQAALFSVSTEVALLQPFTESLPALTKASRRLRSSGATSLYDALYVAAEYLEPVVGRRVIILLSDGGDTTSQKGLLAALERAQQADVVVYGLFTGNFGSSQNLRDLAGERALEALTRETGGELLYPDATPGSQTQDVDERSLRQLDHSFASITAQLRTQYILGFYSSNDRRDGAYRRLTVEMLRPGLRPRARTGYYAPR